MSVVMASKSAVYYLHLRKQRNLPARTFLFIEKYSVKLIKMVKVDVEYCPKCNFEWQCKMLQNFLLQQQPDTEVVCFKGRQGSFEVKIEDNLVHSKLQSLSFPNHESVLENVRRAEKGLPVEKVKEQPIDNCILM